jgi:hypothetical protein
MNERSAFSSLQHKAERASSSTSGKDLIGTHHRRYPQEVGFHRIGITDVFNEKVQRLAPHSCSLLAGNGQELVETFRFEMLQRCNRNRYRKQVETPSPFGDFSSVTPAF